VLFWALGVIPAAVITALKGRWLLFWCGWLTLGILWFIGALAPDEGGPPRDPRWLLAPLLVVVTMLVLGFFGARPAPVLGLDGGVLQASVGNTDLLGIGDDTCNPVPGGRWTCVRYDDGFSGTVAYRVDADWKGCWHAIRVGSPGEGSPRRLSGCVTLVDYVLSG
jgi:hypothetical protein